MFEQLQRAAEISGAGLDALPDEANARPLVLRQAVANWAFVREAVSSDEAAVAYLNRFYTGRPVNTLVAPRSERGRFFYRPGSKAMNFETTPQLLSDVLAALLKARDTEQPLGIAMQAISAPDCLPGLEAENANRLVPAGTHARVWIGNKVTVAPHFDVSENIACVVAGRRRFILFPPEQTANIYPGPMDVTPASVPISMVSLDEPELDRFPRYREALEAALVAELEPGDAIFIPYLWWHGVQSLSTFNILMNYWWNRDAASAGHSYVGFLQIAYAMFSGMAPEHRQAWRALYDHYVFQSGGDPMQALDEGHRNDPPRLGAPRLEKLRQMLRELLGQ